MKSVPSLPREIIAHTGVPLLTEQPFQGMNFETYILHSDQGRFVVKFARTPRLAAELAAEQRILRQIGCAGGLVPQPLEFVQHQGTGISLLTWLPGNNLVELLPTLDRATKEHLLAGAARTLRRIHEWQPELPRPTDWVARALERVRRHVQRGEIDQPIKHPGRFRGDDPAKILARLEQWQLSARTDLVFCHGDFCLPNILAVAGEITGVVDWSAGSYADRRYDLATVMWSIRYNTNDQSLVDLFLDVYGLEEPDEHLWPYEALYVLA